MTPGGTVTTIFSFPYDSVNANTPESGLLQAADGNLYGATPYGGVFGNGALYKLTMTPIAYAFYPDAGPVGSSITLTGVNFTATTSVKIGTKAAAFTVNADISLTITVPSGATTGVITVTNPFGKTSTASAFTVK